MQIPQCPSGGVAAEEPLTYVSLVRTASLPSVVVVKVRESLCRFGLFCLSTGCIKYGLPPKADLQTLAVAAAAGRGSAERRSHSALLTFGRRRSVTVVVDLGGREAQGDRALCWRGCEAAASVTVSTRGRSLYYQPVKGPFFPGFSVTFHFSKQDI